MVSELRKKQYLKAMGIPLWTPRRHFLSDIQPAIVTPESEDSFPAFTESAIESDGNERDQIAWLSLQQEISNCTACELHQTRTRTVFGVGDVAAKCLIIGEAPGQDEDLQGEPFVGRAGQLLNQMLEAIGLSRNSVFIANILKCRPPNNRDPRLEEVLNCSGFLLRQIQWLNPKIILSVGRISAQNLLQKDETISRMRGQVYRHPITGIPVVVTYHPAYLLRSPLEKSKAWNDLLLVQRLLAEL